MEPVMNFNFEKLTTKAREAVVAAQGKAQTAGNPEITPLHLLSALLEERDGLVAPILEHMRAPLGQIQQILAGELGRLPKASGGSSPNLNRQLNDVLQAAAKVAGGMQDEFISTEHLLLALAQVDSPARRILQMSAVDEASLRSGNWPRQRNSPGRSGSVASDQEQSGPDWPAGCRQDGDR